MVVLLPGEVIWHLFETASFVFRLCEISLILLKSQVKPIGLVRKLGQAMNKRQVKLLLGEVLHVDEYGVLLHVEIIPVDQHLLQLFVYLCLKNHQGENLLRCLVQGSSILLSI